MLDQVPQVAPPNVSGRPRVLIPAGVGDAYWVMVKLEAFCRREGISEKPTVIILAEANLWESARLRSAPFLRMVPFINIGDPPWLSVDPISPRPQFMQDIYDESRIRHGRSIFPGFMGYEYFISYNGMINTGHLLEDDELECNWYLPLRISEEQEQFRVKCVEDYGKYAAFYFSNFTDRILAQFSIAAIGESIRHFTNRSGLTPVFIGADWDLNYGPLRALMAAIPGSVNLVGKTSLDQVFGVMRGADIISGYHSGLPNIGIMFKKKTVLLWDYESFPSQVTPLAVAPPETRMRTYIPLDTAPLNIDKYVGVLTDLHGGAA